MVGVAASAMSQSIKQPINQSVSHAIRCLVRTSFGHIEGVP